MTGLEQRGKEAERRMLALIEDSGMPLPDAVEHTPTSVRFLWPDRKVIVVIDLEDES